MAIAAVELFRAASKSSPRFDRVRADEVSIERRAHIEWVLGLSGGISTFEAPTGLRGTWWRLPAGTDYDDALLYVWTDEPGHWSWEPSRDMPLVDYLAALAAVGGKFVRV
jgi:hypothetical protein